MKQIYRIAFLLLALIITTVMPSRGQVFKGGLTAGLLGSQVAGDTYTGFNKLGAYTGIWVSLDFNEHVSFETGISYIQKGSRHNPDEKRQDFTIYFLRLGYIEMPFLLKFQLKNKITLEAGPSLSYLLHSYEELDKLEVSYGKFNLFNPSFMAGIGFPINEKWSAHLRTDNSILSIRADAVNGARYRLFDRGQYNDCILLFLNYKL